MGWDYAIQWLTILPFEITAAGLTIQFWRDDINIGVWITVFLVALSIIQVFGVRGYGEGGNSHICSPKTSVLTAS
jgi:amino acid transporter